MSFPISLPNIHYFKPIFYFSLVPTAWYFFKLEIAFKPGKEANISFALKNSEQAEIVTFNRLLVNYNIHFLFYWRGDQTARVDSYDTGQKNMEWKSE